MLIDERKKPFWGQARSSISKSIGLGAANADMRLAHHGSYDLPSLSVKPDKG